MQYLFMCLVLFISTAQAQESFAIAAGAGYKKPLIKLYQLFARETGIEVTPVFGNMRTVLSLTEKSGRISLVVGDLDFLKSTRLFEKSIKLGQGKLVLAWADTPPPSGHAALRDANLGRVAMPDPKKAIYGRAAEQFLQSSDLKAVLGDRLLVIATVPQVSSYLVARSIDAGFINLTDALALGNHIGGFSELPEETYQPITIIIAVVKGHGMDDPVVRFIRFLDTPSAKRILLEAGL